LRPAPNSSTPSVVACGGLCRVRMWLRPAPNSSTPSVVACGGLVQGPDVVETSYEMIYS